jgi:hypothetical protein
MEEDGMATATAGALATQTSTPYVRATPEAIWEAITASAWTERYG